MKARVCHLASCFVRYCVRFLADVPCFRFISCGRMSKIVKLGDFSSVSNLPKEVGRASVHGVIKSLSPMKKSRKLESYFDGVLSDGSSSVRIHGFDAKARDKLTPFFDLKKSVALVDCELVRSREGEIEIRIGRNSTAAESTHSFDIEVMATEDSVVSLKDV